MDFYSLALLSALHVYCSVICTFHKHSTFWKPSEGKILLPIADIVASIGKRQPLLRQKSWKSTDSAEIPNRSGRSVKAAMAQYVVFLDATMIWALQLLSAICARWMRTACARDERFYFAAMSQNDFRRKECHGH